MLQPWQTRWTSWWLPAPLHPALVGTGAPWCSRRPWGRAATARRRKRSSSSGSSSSSAAGARRRRQVRLSGVGAHGFACCPHAHTGAHPSPINPSQPPRPLPGRQIRQRRSCGGVQSTWLPSPPRSARWLLTSLAPSSPASSGTLVLVCARLLARMCVGRCGRGVGTPNHPTRLPPTTTHPPTFTHPTDTHPPPPRPPTPRRNTTLAKLVGEHLALAALPDPAAAAAAAAGAAAGSAAAGGASAAAAAGTGGRGGGVAAAAGAVLSPAEAAADWELRRRAFETALAQELDLYRRCATTQVCTCARECMPGGGAGWVGGVGGGGLQPSLVPGARLATHSPCPPTRPPFHPPLPLPPTPPTHPGVPKPGCPHHGSHLV